MFKKTVLVGVSLLAMVIGFTQEGVQDFAGEKVNKIAEVLQNVIGNGKGDIESQFERLSAEITAREVDVVQGIKRLNGETAEIRRYEESRNKQWEATKGLLEDFRFAAKDGGYPVVVRNAAYTEKELMEQIELTLFEFEGQERMVKKVVQDRVAAEQKIKELIQLRQELEVAQVTLDAKLQMALVNGMTSEQQEMFDQIEALTQNTSRVIDRPIRSVPELLKQDNRTTTTKTSVEDFLKKWPRGAESELTRIRALARIAFR